MNNIPVPFKSVALLRATSFDGPLKIISQSDPGEAGSVFESLSLDLPSTIHDWCGGVCSKALKRYPQLSTNIDTEYTSAYRRCSVDRQVHEYVRIRFSLVRLPPSRGSDSVRLASSHPQSPMRMPTEKGAFSSFAPEYLRLLHGKTSQSGLNAASQPRSISDKDLARAILSVLCIGEPDVHFPAHKVSRVVDQLLCPLGGSSLIGAPPTDPPLFPVLDLMTDGSPTYFNTSPRIDDVDFGAPFGGTLSAANVDFGAPFDDTLSSIINFDNLGLRLAPVDSHSATRIFAPESGTPLTSSFPTPRGILIPPILLSQSQRFSMWTLDQTHVRYPGTPFPDRDDPLE